MDRGARIGIDQPVAGQPGAGWFHVRGWAAVGGLPARPRFEIAGRPPAGTLIWPVDRPDVALSLGLPDRLWYGFAAWVRVAPDIAGPAILRVLLDTPTGPVAKEVPVEVGRERARVVIDEPGPLALVQDTIVLHGWTYGYASPVVAVRVQGPGFEQLADFGIARLDVAAVGASAPATPAGFQARVSLHATMVVGPVPLAVVVEDVDGVAAVAPVAVRQALPNEPDIALERLIDHGTHVDLEGFVSWPAPAPRSPTIAVEVDDRVVVSTAADGSRPDVLRRLPERASTPRCGFVVSAPRGSADRVRLRAHSEDGRVATLLVPLSPRETAATQTHRVPGTDALATCITPGSTLLDWGVGVAAAGVPVTVVSPPGDGEALPYRDGAFDFVAIPPGVTRRAEALRVAAAAVLQPASSGTGYEVLAPASTGRPAPSDAHTGRLLIVRIAEREGYARNVNDRVAAGSGEVVVLLDADAAPDDGAQAALLAAFERWPRAGVVGSKLLSADGILLDAGSVICRDGSLLTLGSGVSDASAPPYAHVRRVDCCSCAAVASPAGIWDQVGGLDDRFSTVDYAIADYCLAVRERGHDVIVQPASTVVRGDTPGVADAASAKAARERDRLALAEKWAARLEGHPPPSDAVDPATARELLLDAQLR